jgi:hypothetical protein
VIDNGPCGLSEVRHHPVLKQAPHLGMAGRIDAPIVRSKPAAWRAMGARLGYSKVGHFMDLLFHAHRTRTKSRELASRTAGNFLATHPLPE